MRTKRKYPVFLLAGLCALCLCLAGAAIAAGDTSHITHARADVSPETVATVAVNGGEAEEYSDFAEVQKILDKDTTVQATVTLYQNVKLEHAFAVKGIYNNSAREVTLDLNGCVLDRGLRQDSSEADLKNDSYAIGLLPSNDWRSAKLRIQDSAPHKSHAATEYADCPDGGIVTGGVYTMGGGIYIDSGECTLASGTVYKNYAAHSGVGGGVYVGVRQKFTMTGGAIKNNGFTQSNTQQEQQGGGVYAGGAFTMEGGTIAENSAKQGGGVYTDGTFTMTGGTIADNAADEGGGVFVYRGNNIVLRGGAQITDNKTAGDATKNSNVFLQTAQPPDPDDENAYIKVDGNFTGTAGISLPQAAPLPYAAVRVTNGGTTQSGAFTSDEGGRAKCYARNDTWILGKGIASVEESDTENFDGGMINYYTRYTTQGAETGLYHALQITKVYVRIVLYEDIRLALNDPTLTFEGAKHWTLDVNGHIFDRAYNEETDAEGKFGPAVILQKNGYGNCGVLTVTDGDPTATHAGEYENYPAGGVITGGYDGMAGGVYLQAGELRWQGGTLYRNYAGARGGGVFVGAGATFTLSGGKIAQNGFYGENNQEGGGVYLQKAAYENGVLQTAGGVFTMTGGSIEENRAKKGGGVYVNPDVTFVMSGGEITGNAADEGGGVWIFDTYGEMTLDGTARVTGNTKRASASAPDNIFLSVSPHFMNCRILLGEHFTGSAGITMPAGDEKIFPYEAVRTQGHAYTGQLTADGADFTLSAGDGALLYGKAQSPDPTPDPAPDPAPDLAPDPAPESSEGQKPKKHTTAYRTLAIVWGAVAALAVTCGTVWLILAKRRDRKMRKE